MLLRLSQRVIVSIVGSLIVCFACSEDSDSGAAQSQPPGSPSAGRSGASNLAGNSGGERDSDASVVGSSNSNSAGTAGFASVTGGSTSTAPNDAGIAGTSNAAGAPPATDAGRSIYSVQCRGESSVCGF